MTTLSITGSTAAEIADSVRDLLERGALVAGDPLPPVRTLADLLGVNRNTVVAAYRLLAQSGLVVSRGRGGTRITDRAPVPQEGYAGDSVLRDVGTGNPDPTRIPDPSHVLPRVAGRPVLYGEPVLDRELERWARDWFTDALPAGMTPHLTVTGGAVDAVERLLAQALTRDDAVALEDPCFLASIHTVRLGGYRAVPVSVDDEGMTVDGLQAALDAGVRAVVCTPRAQNPTGVSLSERRAEQLKEVLGRHPYVLVIEDDHFSMLATHPYRSIISPAHRRWALVRSVSKFLGPDMCLALTASDAETAARLSLRLSPGTTWVSHLLQRLTHALVSDPAVVADVAATAQHYADRNARFAALLSARGLGTRAGEGLSVWVRLPVGGREAARHLMRRGWLARTGDEFVLADPASADALRLTVHDLSDAETERLADDLAAAVHSLLPARKEI